MPSRKLSSSQRSWMCGLPNRPMGAKRFPTMPWLPTELHPSGWSKLVWALGGLSCFTVCLWWYRVRLVALAPFDACYYCLPSVSSPIQVFPKIGVFYPPKWMVKRMKRMDDLGGFPINFGNTYFMCWAGACIHWVDEVVDIDFSLGWIGLLNATTFATISSTIMLFCWLDRIYIYIYICIHNIYSTYQYTCIHVHNHIYIYIWYVYRPQDISLTCCETTMYTNVHLRIKGTSFKCPRCLAVAALSPSLDGLVRPKSRRLVAFPISKLMLYHVITIETCPIMSHLHPPATARMLGKVLR